MRRLVAIIPGGREAIRKFKASKFWKNDNDPEWMAVFPEACERGRNEWKRGEGLFKQYWRQETRCQFEGHHPSRDLPGMKPHYLPVCTVCHFMVPSDSRV